MSNPDSRRDRGGEGNEDLSPKYQHHDADHDGMFELMDVDGKHDNGEDGAPTAEEKAQQALAREQSVERSMHPNKQAQRVAMHAADIGIPARDAARNALFPSMERGYSVRYEQSRAIVRGY